MLIRIITSNIAVQQEQLDTLTADMVQVDKFINVNEGIDFNAMFVSHNNIIDDVNSYDKLTREFYTHLGSYITIINDNFNQIGAKLSSNNSKLEFVMLEKNWS